MQIPTVQPTSHHLSECQEQRIDTGCGKQLCRQEPDWGFSSRVIFEINQIVRTINFPKLSGCLGLVRLPQCWGLLWFPVPVRRRWVREPLFKKVQICSVFTRSVTASSLRAESKLIEWNLPGGTCCFLCSYFSAGQCFVWVITAPTLWPCPIIWGFCPQTSPWAPVIQPNHSHVNSSMGYLKVCTYPALPVQKEEARWRFNTGKCESRHRSEIKC